MLPCPALSSGSPRHAPRAQAKGLFIAVSEEKEAGNRKLERRGREQAVKGPTDPTDLESLPGTVGGRNSVHTLPPQCPTCCPLPALCLFLHVLVKVLSEGHPLELSIQKQAGRRPTLRELSANTQPFPSVPHTSCTLSFTEASKLLIICHRVDGVRAVSPRISRQREWAGVLC